MKTKLELIQAILINSNLKNDLLMGQVSLALFMLAQELRDING